MVGIYDRQCEAHAVFETVRPLQNGHLQKGRNPRKQLCTVFAGRHPRGVLAGSWYE